MSLVPADAITIDDVVEATGYSIQHIYRMIKEGTFPEPIRYGPKCSRWTPTQIKTWSVERKQKYAQPTHADTKRRIENLQREIDRLKQRIKEPAQVEA
jgi:predicted DNA-binding transcriptional regulator AlpA